MESYTRTELVASKESIWTICAGAFEAFEKCKMEKGNNPEVCLRESTAVLGCSQKVMRQLVKSCQPELDKSVKCIEENNMRTIPCEQILNEYNECFERLVHEKFISK
ncbi:hypothetical protein ACTA71_002254 [Dictyostelium dimigraforme]